MSAVAYGRNARLGGAVYRLRLRFFGGFFRMSSVMVIS